MNTDHVQAAENRDAGRRLALPAAREIQVRILRYLHDHGPADDETIAKALSLKVSTTRRRRQELLKLRVVVPAGNRQWKAAPPLSATCPPRSGQDQDARPERG